MKATDAPPCSCSMHLFVNGMTCSSCEESIKNALQALGASDIVASSSKKSVSFNYEPSLISLQELIQAIDNCGFEVIQPHNQISNSSATRRRSPVRANMNSDITESQALISFEEHEASEMLIDIVGMTCQVGTR